MIDMEINPVDYKFLESIRVQVLALLESEEEMIELEPMNSYQRRLVHKFSSACGLTSQSVSSEEGERFVCLIKNENTKNASEIVLPKPANAIDFGDQIFQTIVGTKIELRTDGVGVEGFGNRSGILHQRVIDGDKFRVRNGQIVCPGEENW